MHIQPMARAAPVEARPRLATADLIHVCPLAHVERVLAASGARHLVTLVNQQTMIATPARIAPAQHLRLAMNDIAEPQEGLLLPAHAHVAALIEFVRTWDREAPLLIHCLAGISRSTAGALIALSVLNPDVSEERIAARLRAASATAMPNRLLVRLADEILGRDGRMTEALSAMGPARMVSEGRPFALPAQIDG